MANTSGRTFAIDAETLMEYIMLEGDAFVVHRPGHGHRFNGNGDCWCSPLVATHEEMSEMSLPALQRLLDAHFQTH